SPERVMARILRKIVAEAGALGELKYRRTLVEDELKQVSASLKRKARQTREFRKGVREHRQWLARMRFLLQEENEQLGRLTSEMQAQLVETVDLLEKTAFNVAVRSLDLIHTFFGQIRASAHPLVPSTMLMFALANTSTSITAIVCEQ